MAEQPKIVVSTTFIDAESGKEYTIKTSSEDAKRIKTDMKFATSFFHQAKKDNEAVSMVTKERPIALLPPSPLPEQHLEEFDQTYDNSDDPNESNSVLTQHEDVCHWTTSMCMLLLASYKATQESFNSGKISKTQAWNNISQAMKLKNYGVSGLKCQSKFASLKKTYKSTKDHNKKSGNSRRTWKYLAEMDEIFGNKPWINPVATTSTSTPMNYECGTSEATAADQNTRNRKSNTPEYLKDLLEEKIKARKIKEVQHEQKLDEVRKMNILLEKLLQQNA